MTRLSVINSLLVTLLFFSCQSSSPNKKTGGSKASKSENPAADTLVILDSIYAPDSSSAVLPAATIIREQIAAQLLPVIKMRKTITSPTQSIQFTITDLEPGQLHVLLEPSQSQANIRISQVILPDNSTDGPFGRELDYEIRQKGDYTLIFSRSNMASGSPEGDLDITIER